MNNLTIATFVLSVVLPLLVGLVTKESTSQQTKAILLAGLAAASTIVQHYVDSKGVGFDVQAQLQQFVVIWVTAIASYYGLTKPIGLAAHVNKNLGRKDGQHAA